MPRDHADHAAPQAPTTDSTDAPAPPRPSPARRRHLPAHTLRWGLLAVAVGAVVAALVSLFLTGFRSSHGLEAHSPGGGAPAGRVNAAFGSSHAGDCLTWNNPKALDLTKVSCADQHLFEVTADIDLSRYPGREFGPGSQFPDSLRFAELREEQCEPAAESYLGGRLDPRGKFVVGMLNPAETGWAGGERLIRCGLQLVSAGGNATQKTVGKVRDSDQSRVFDTGVCIGINQSLPTNEPVDCTKPHAYEVMSVEDLGARFTGGPPANADQDKYMQQQCPRVAAQYLGSPDALSNKTLTIFWDNIDARSWLVGSKKLNCLVGKSSQDGFSAITGTAKGDILIDGQAPVPPPNTGRSTPTPLPGAAPIPR